MSIQIVQLDPKALIGYKNNARKHSGNQVEEICESIREFGFTNPILIDERKNIIAGHGRTQAALKLKLETVPCIIIPNLTEKQKRKLILADNKLALNASWDNAILLKELEELGDLALTGFDESEIQGLELAVKVSTADYDSLFSVDGDVKPKVSKEIECVCPHCGKNFRQKI